MRLFMTFSGLDQVSSLVVIRSSVAIRWRSGSNVAVACHEASQPVKDRDGAGRAKRRPMLVERTRQHVRTGTRLGGRQLLDRELDRHSPEHAPAEPHFNTSACSGNRAALAPDDRAPLSLADRAVLRLDSAAGVLGAVSLTPVSKKSTPF